MTADYQAKENVRKAVETRNPAERQKWLAESLRFASLQLYVLLILTIG